MTDADGYAAPSSISSNQPCESADECPEPLSPVSPLSPLRYGQPDQTVIFFDWDDTLFPTTQIFDRWGIPARAHLWDDLHFTEEQETSLLVWRAALCEQLSTALSLSNRVVIVTNSKRPWVMGCATRFAPDTLPLLARTRVVYAHEAFAESKRNMQTPTLRGNTRRLTPEEHSDSQTNAKVVAMKREVQDFYSQYERQTWKNIISIGDMEFERDALQEVTFTRQSPPREWLRTKTWTVTSEPSIGRAIVSLKMRSTLPPAVVLFNGNIDVSSEGTVQENRDHIAKVLNIEWIGREVPPDLQVNMHSASSSLQHLEQLLANIEQMIGYKVTLAPARRTLRSWDSRAVQLLEASAVHLSALKFSKVTAGTSTCSTPSVQDQSPLSAYSFSTACTDASSPSSQVLTTDKQFELVGLDPP